MVVDYRKRNHASENLMHLWIVDWQKKYSFASYLMSEMKNGSSDHMRLNHYQYHAEHLSL